MTLQMSREEILQYLELIEPDETFVKASRNWRRWRRENVRCENKQKVAKMLYDNIEKGVDFRKIQEGWSCPKLNSDEVTIETCLSFCASEIAGIFKKMKEGR